MQSSSQQASSHAMTTKCQELVEEVESQREREREQKKSGQSWKELQDSGADCLQRELRSGVSF
jgi:hypothetical protein